MTEQGTPPPRRRRRGAELEAVLLDEAWAQLDTVGYDDLLIDAVARAAGTSRAVIYRRWPNKASLVHAAIRAHAGTLSDEVPDTGSLADDVREVLRRLTARMERIGVETMIGLLGMLDELPPEVTGIVPTVLEQLIRRARDRGEIGDGAIPSMVLETPTTLLRYRMIATRTAPSEQTIDEITEQVFLPLVRHFAAPEG